MRVRGLAGPPAPAVPGDDRLAAPVSRRAQRPGAAVRAGGAGSGVGDRHHLHPDGRGLAVPGGDPGPLLALVVGWAMSERITDDLALDALEMALARRRPPRACCITPTAAASTPAATTSGPRPPRHRLQHEPAGQLLGQRRRRELLRHAEDRARPRRRVGHAGRGARGELFEYIEVFYNGQRRHSALGYLSPRAFEQRAATEVLGNLTPVSTKPGQVQRPLYWRRCGTSSFGLTTCCPIIEGAVRELQGSDAETKRQQVEAGAGPAGRPSWPG